MYHHCHFTADKSRLNDQVGTVGGQMEICMQVSWMPNRYTLLGSIHTLYLDLCYLGSETS